MLAADVADTADGALFDASPDVVGTETVANTSETEPLDSWLRSDVDDEADAPANDVADTDWGPDGAQDTVAPEDATAETDAGSTAGEQSLASFLALEAAGDQDGLLAFAEAYDMPICEADQCLFLVDVPESVSSATLPGDFNGWDTASAPALIPLVGTLHYALVTLPAGDSPSPAAVLHYKVRFDGVWALDPNNRYIAFADFGPNSAIYPATRGRITTLSAVWSPQLQNERTVWVYLPAGYFAEPEQHFSVMYMQDGFNVFTNPQAPFGAWNVDQTADSAMASGEAEPIIIVGIDTDNRNEEYLYVSLDKWGQPTTPQLSGYAAFVANTLKPLVDTSFRTRPEREHTAMAGSSLGGISSLWIGWHHWETFGKVASFSGSYWVGETLGTDSMWELLSTNAAGVPPGGLRIYFDAGDTDFEGIKSYGADSAVYSDWVRNTLISMGWDSRPEWQTGDAAIPENLPPSTPLDEVPAMWWSAEPPPPYSGWSGWLRPDLNLASLIGPGHQHNEPAWQKRFRAALIFLFPGPNVLP